MKDVISVSTTAPASRVFEVMISLEMIKQWEPAHRTPMVRHEWIPDTGRIKVGNVLRITTPIWTFEARCAGVRENEIKWKFIEGPLKGVEYWRVEPSGQGCRIVKHLEYETSRLVDKLLWHLGGRCIHNYASKKQLKAIKYLARENNS